ncbi:MAG: DNA polymerase [Phascolarctobacterium sp.]|nr:DNA polymerase [Phascolarctobacterium sp.]
MRDADVERNVQEKLKKKSRALSRMGEYWLDQEINDRSVAVDMKLVKAAIEMNERSRNILTESAKRLTEIENPNSVQQLKNWLAKKGIFTKSLGKKQVDEMLKTAPGELTEVLTLRRQLFKSSVKKYKAMQNAVYADGRVRGMFQFYGVNRSGRWAGSLIQLHNLPQNHITDLEAARSLVRKGDYEAVEMLYGDVHGTLSQLIRTVFIPREKHKFIVADFSAIEARVLAWFAGETWRSEVFESGGDIYCASASQMFKVPVEKHGVNAHLRQKGKIAELALGYGSSAGALKNMGALEIGLKEDELWALVDSWRKSNLNITKLWWAVDRASLKAVREKSTEKAADIKFTYESGMFFYNPSIWSAARIREAPHRG